MANVGQHKRMAMGQNVTGYARGGSVMSKMDISGTSGRLLKSGKPDSPIEKAKRANGVPGMKSGGKC